MSTTGEDQLLPRLCAQCGCQLTALPAMGTCPECGRAYTDEIIVLYGAGRGAYHTSPATAQGPVLWLMVTFVTFVVITIVPVLFGYPDPSQVIAGLIFWSGVLGWWIQRRWRARHLPELVQVRIGTSGCVQHDDIGGKTIYNQHLGLMTIICWVILGWSLQFENTGTVIVWVIMISLIYIVVAFIRRQRRNADADPQWIGLRDDLMRQIPTGWDAIDGVHIGRTHRGNTRLKIVQELRPDRTAYNPVDVEVPGLSDAAVDQLRAFIASCRLSAKNV